MNNDILTFGMYDNGEIRVYLEDKVGHHASTTIPAEALLYNLFQVLKDCYGGTETEKGEIGKQNHNRGYTRLLKRVVFEV